MKLDWRLGKISACFAWLDKFCSGVWDWCGDAILDELGSFTLIEFSYGFLVWIILSGHPDSVLCILSRLLVNLCVDFLGIKY